MSPMAGILNYMLFLRYILTFMLKKVKNSLVVIRKSVNFAVN